MIAKLTLLLMIGAALSGCSSEILKSKEEKKREYVKSHDCALARHVDAYTEWSDFKGKVVPRSGYDIYKCHGVDNPIYLDTEK